MPYKRRTPVSEEEMDKTRWEGHHSVCQNLRDIYHLTDNKEIRYKCRLAMAMTKAMNSKLKWYKKDGDVQNNKDVQMSDDIHADMED